MRGEVWRGGSRARRLRKERFSALEVEITLCDPKGFEINLLMRGGYSRGGNPRPEDLTPPWAPFWLHFGFLLDPKIHEKSLTFWFDFLAIFVSFLDPFWSHFLVISGEKICEKTF